ncbi:hypothetical protein A2U01_0041214, partial [Trifolium medium]|nr:hypothetical protein [Trifolium medium]
ASVVPHAAFVPAAVVNSVFVATPLFSTRYVLLLVDSQCRTTEGCRTAVLGGTAVHSKFQA